MESELYAPVYARMRTHDGELDIGRAELGTPVVNVLDPLLVVAEAIRGYTDELHIALLEVRRPTDIKALTCIPWPLMLMPTG